MSKFKCPVIKKPTKEKLSKIRKNLLEMFIENELLTNKKLKMVKRQEECIDKGDLLGKPLEPMQCREMAEKTYNCKYFMYSHAFPIKGCYCCLEGDGDVKSNENEQWHIY